MFGCCPYSHIKLEDAEKDVQDTKEGAVIVWKTIKECGCSCHDGSAAVMC